LPCIREGFAFDSWPDHGRLRGQHLLQLPAGLSSGRYRFELEWIPLGEIAIAAPERRFDSPSLISEVNSLFTTANGEAVATLAGLATSSSSQGTCMPTPQPGEPCSLALAWHAEAETAVSYHVFVHLVDEAGNLLAQSDGVPGNWTRPTTGWLPGEYILDNHNLNVPESLPGGPLRLRIGLYDPDTGTRLSSDEADFIEWDVAGGS
jgi:hypothetical protein